MSNQSRWSRPAAAAMAICLLAVIAACSSTPATVSPQPSKQFPRLERQADLAACPTTSSTVPVAPGQALPNVTLPCVGHGPSVDLADLRGTPTVVNIYETYCGPCQKEAPSLASAAAADNGKVRFLGVDADDPAHDSLTFAAAVGEHYPIVSDEDDVAARNFGDTFPVTLFVNSAGSIVDVDRAGAFANTAALQHDIKRYLGVS